MYLWCMTCTFALALLGNLACHQLHLIEMEDERWTIENRLENFILYLHIHRSVCMQYFCSTKQGYLMYVQ